MAIPLSVGKEKEKKNKLLGLKMPLDKGSFEGYFESTTLTADAVKEDIRNLLRTRKGERLFQPDLGLGLDKFLFENITDEMKQQIQDDIKSTIKKWLPFVSVHSISIELNQGSSDLTNQLNIKVSFFINSTPNMLDSVTVVIE